MELHEELGAVRREIVLPVDRERAWELVSELEGWLADEADVHLEPGAEGTVTFEDGSRRHVAVEEVEAERRVALCWWSHDGDRALVELTLDDVAEGTRLTVVELPLQTLRAVGTALSGGVSSTRGPQMAALACA
jgi:uncharacterized protein YndB with AHSA1/START domain